MPRKNFKKSLLGLLLCVLSGCAGMPEDRPICTEVSPVEGFCVRIISGKSFTVNESQKYEGKTWWEMRPAMILMPASTWASLKAWIIKTCKNNQQCDKLASWQRTVEIIDTQVELKKP